MPDASTSSSQRAIVIGASGGIGAALLENLRQRSAFASVTGLGRHSDPPIDLTDETTIAEAAAHIARGQDDVRLAIVATGFLHGEGFMPEKSLAQIDAGHLTRAFALNAIGPALLMKHLLPLLPAQGQTVFALLSARVGSIGDNALGGWYAYRASKAALNQLVRTAAIELKRRRPEAICVAIHPGTVDTKLSAPFAKADLAVRSPDVAAAEILVTLDRLTPNDSGGFFDAKGQAIPW